MPETTQPSTRTVLLDVAGLGTIALLLVGIHFLLPSSITQALVFKYASFPSYTIFTAAFVHASNAHLYGNLVGYALTIVYAYALSLHSHGLRWFRRTVLASILLVPILTNLTSYIILSLQYPETDPVSRGFSGVVAGFGGVLLVSLYRALRVKYNADLAWAVSLSLFLILMQLLDIQYRGGLSLIVTGLVGLAIILEFGRYLYEHDVRLQSRADLRRISAGGLLVTLVGIVLGILVLALFPQASSLVEDGNFTNIFAHIAGFLWGIVVAAVLVFLGGDRAPG